MVKKKKQKSISPLRNFFNTFSVEDVEKRSGMKNRHGKLFFFLLRKYFLERERSLIWIFLFIGSISLTNRRAQHFPFFHIVHHLYSIATQSVVVTSSTKVINWKGWCRLFALLSRTNWSGTRSPLQKTHYTVALREDKVKLLSLLIHHFLPYFTVPVSISF